MSESTGAPVLAPLSLDTATPLMDTGHVSTPPSSQPPTIEPPSLPTNMAEIPLTFLLISGRRRTMSFAASTTIGRVKELVWNSWSSDWSDERPPAPNYLRILYLGKMLHDEDVLECEFSQAIFTLVQND
jgi:Ubiquitin-2 like Rad60 SUMO-like